MEFRADRLKCAEQTYNLLQLTRSSWCVIQLKTWGTGDYRVDGTVMALEHVGRYAMASRPLCWEHAHRALEWLRRGEPLPEDWEAP